MEFVFLRTQFLSIFVAFANQFLTDVTKLIPIFYVHDKPLDLIDSWIKAMFIPEHKFFVSQHPLERIVLCYFIVAHKIVYVGEPIFLIVIAHLDNLGGNILVFD